MAPGVQPKSRFPAGLFEKCQAVPAVFNRHLRKQQATVPAPADEQSVPSHLDLVRLDWSQRGKYAQGDSQAGDFLQTNGKETGILRRRCPCGLRHRPEKRSHREDIAHTAPYLAAEIECGENPAGFRQVGRRAFGIERTALDERCNGLVRQP